MWLFYTLSVPVGLVLFCGLVTIINSIEKHVSLRVALKGVPSARRAEVIKALGTMYKHDGPWMIFGIRRKMPPDDSPGDGE
jgi:hypothetical protein